MSAITPTSSRSPRSSSLGVSGGASTTLNNLGTTAINIQGAGFNWSPAESLTAACGVPAFISNGYGRGKYTPVGCNPYVARYPSKDWRRMKRSAEARCHADILGKRCRLAPVTYQECA